MYILSEEVCILYKCAIILAAGEGKRMKSNIPKVLHNVCGKEMINHVIDNIRKAGIDEVDVVIGKGAEKVRQGTESRKIFYSIQEEQLGTGHAVMCAEEFLKNKKGSVAIFVGDGPLITNDTVTKLAKYHEEENCSATILTSVMTDPLKYGRIIRNTQGEVEKIVEFKDCNEEEVKVKEINSGMYCFDIELVSFLHSYYCYILNVVIFSNHSLAFCSLILLNPKKQRLSCFLSLKRDLIKVFISHLTSLLKGSFS